MATRPRLLSRLLLRKIKPSGRMELRQQDRYCSRMEHTLRHRPIRMSQDRLYKQTISLGRLQRRRAIILADRRAGLCIKVTQRHLLALKVDSPAEFQ